MASTTTAAPAKSALILGATGAVGAPLLAALLAAPEYTRVREAGRRVTSADALPDGAAAGGKLEQRTVDYDQILAGDRQGLDEAPWDVVFITMGTSRKRAGGAAAFERIDREYVLAAAQAAKSADPTHSQRLVYCSSHGADSTSSFLYMKSKGLTELGLAALGYTETIIVRPAFLNGKPNASIGQRLFGPVMTGLSYTPLGPSIQIYVPEVASAMHRAGTIGASALPASAQALKTGETGKQFTVIGNPGLLALAKDA